MYALLSALEQKLSEAETEKFHIKQMRDLFEQKAAQLATEIVGQYATEHSGNFAFCFIKQQLFPDAGKKTFFILCCNIPS